MKQKIGLIGGLISAVVIVAFAIYLATNSIPQNIASWIMWTILDTLILISCLAAGNKRPWLPAGYTLGAFLVTLILLTRGVWHWGTVETISAIGATAATACWWKLGPKSAIIASTLAMTLAGIPAMNDAWFRPDPASWWLWGGVAFSCALSCYGAKAWTIEERFFPCSSFIFNTTMTILVLR
ncbi:MAG: hypothetical protein AAB635_01590 [Patescibacteria group bacterium]